MEKNLHTNNLTRRRTRRSVVVTAVVTAVALLAAACGSGDEAGKDGKSAKLAVLHSASVAGVVPRLMDADGIDKDNGIDLTLTNNAKDGGITLAELLAKRVDFANAPVEGVFEAVAKGAPLVIVASVYRGGGILVVRTPVADKLDVAPTASGPDRLRALKGLKIGVPAVVSGTYKSFVRYLGEAGLDPNKDVTLVPMADAAAIVAAMKQGAVDAGFGQTGSLEVNVAAGEAKTYMSLADGDFDELGSAHQMAGVIVTRQDVVQKHPPLVRGVFDAIVGTEKKVADDPSGTGTFVREKLLTRTGQAAFDLIWKTSVKAFPTDGLLTRENYDWAVGLMAGEKDQLDYDKIVYEKARG
ncbi:ABC transporter substrate-binding protein [Streptomyces sp. NPDC055078]